MKDDTGDRPAQEQLKKFYYDPSKYNTYLEQLGIKYPTLEKPGN